MHGKSLWHAHLQNDRPSHRINWSHLPTSRKRTPHQTRSRASASNSIFLEIRLPLRAQIRGGLAAQITPARPSKPWAVSHIRNISRGRSRSSRPPRTHMAARTSERAGSRCATCGTGTGPRKHRIARADLQDALRMGAGCSCYSRQVGGCGWLLPQSRRGTAWIARLAIGQLHLQASPGSLPTARAKSARYPRSYK